MKKFNINHGICIQITDEGWRHLKKTVGDDYIKHSIEPYKTEINNEIWYKLQAHQVFDLLPIYFSGRPTYNTNVLIDEKDLTDHCIQHQYI